VSQTVYNDHLQDLLHQAETHYRQGDLVEARQIYEAMLQIDQQNPAALEGLKLTQQARTSGSPTTTTAPLLELDLSMATLTPTPAAPPSRTAVPADDTPSVKDLLEAAGDIGVEHEVTAWDGGLASEQSGSHATATSNDVAPQAMHLLNNAQQLFDQHKYTEAMQLAGRALALHESAPGAQELIDQARSILEQRAHEADHALQSAIELIERGQPEPAVPMLKQVLELVPGHAEATEYLAKAATAIDNGALNVMMRAATENKPMFEQDLLALETRASGTPTNAATSPARHEVAPTETSSIPLAAAPPPPPPPPPPVSTRTGPAGAIAGATSGVKPTPPRAQARPVASAAPVKANNNAGLIGAISSWFGGVAQGVMGRIISVVLALAVLTVAGWITGGIDALLGNSESAAVDSLSQDEAAIAAARAERAARRAAAQAPAAGAANVAGSVASAAPSPAASNHASDPKTLRDQARAASQNGDLAGAVKLLEQARALDSANFDLADELQRAKQRFVAHQADLARFQEAQDAWKLGDYEEAMRLLYRLPDELKPPHYNRWLADGWYNLGVLALQRGDAAEAAQFFYDGLELNPDDKEMQRHREVAKRYKGRSTDATYSTYVSGLTLRDFRK
jgi:tetratricopeptide (TPR) repeat protein